MSRRVYVYALNGLHCGCWYRRLAYWNRPERGNCCDSILSCAPSQRWKQVKQKEKHHHRLLNNLSNSRLSVQQLRILSGTWCWYEREIFLVIENKMRFATRCKLQLISLVIDVQNPHLRTEEMPFLIRKQTIVAQLQFIKIIIATMFGDREPLARNTIQDDVSDSLREARWCFLSPSSSTALLHSLQSEK